MDMDREHFRSRTGSYTWITYPDHWELYSIVGYIIHKGERFLQAKIMYERTLIKDLFLLADDSLN